MQRTMSIAGERNAFGRNYGAPVAHEPTLIDKAIAKTIAFCGSLLKQLSYVFMGIVFDMMAKKAKAKTSEKLRGALGGSKEEDEKTEHNRGRLYGNRYEDPYSKYDNMNSRQYNNEVPFNRAYN
jgi:hypothetical protein